MSFKNNYHHSTPYTRYLSDQPQRSIVSNTHVGFDDTAEVGTTSFDDGFEVGERLFGLLDDAARDDLCGRGVDWHATRNEDEVAGFDCLGVGSDCGRGAWGETEGEIRSG